jgi:hypothetical protein
MKNIKPNNFTCSNDISVKSHNISSKFHIISKVLDFLRFSLSYCGGTFKFFIKLVTYQFKVLLGILVNKQLTHYKTINYIFNSLVLLA